MENNYLDKLNPEKKVVISKEDTDNIRNFFKHFNIPMTDALNASLDAFDKMPTYDNQELVKIAVCECMATSDHEAFKDELVKSLMASADSIRYKASFDKEVEEVLSVPSVEKKD